MMSVRVIVNEIQSTGDSIDDPERSDFAPINRVKVKVEDLYTFPWMVSLTAL